MRLRVAAPALLLLAGAAVAGCRPAPPPATGTGAVRWTGRADLVLTGPEVEVADALAGDVMVAGARIDFRGSAGGDYVGAGADQRLHGRVSGSVRAAGGDVVLGGEVGRNVTAAGGRVLLAEGSSVAGNTYVAAGSLEVRGTLGGLLRVAGGEVVLDGPVEGDVEVRAGALRVGPRARIAGDLRYRAPERRVSIDPAATVAGSVIALPAPPPALLPRVLRLLWAVGFVASSAVLVLLLPGTTRAAASAVEARPGVALGFGVLWLIGMPLLALAAVISLAGIPLAVMAGFVWAAALYLGGAIPSLWLGRKVLRGEAGAGRGPLVLAAALGAALFQFVGLLPVAGPLIWLLASLLGVGALVSEVGTRREAAA